MARQTGEIILEGTIDGITFYKIEGKGYARSKSCLKGERVKRDPGFKRTMQSARRLARGSQLASKVYRSLPREEQVYGLFQELKSIGIRAIKEGKDEAEVMRLLEQHLMKQDTWRTGTLRNKVIVDVPAKKLKQSPPLFQVIRNERIETGRRIRSKKARQKSLRWIPHRQLPEAEGSPHRQREHQW